VIETNHYNLHTGPWPNPGNGQEWLQWTASPPSFGDLDGDGKMEVIGVPNIQGTEAPEIIVSLNDGFMYAFSADGQRVWRYDYRNGKATIKNNYAKEGGGAIFFVSNDRTGSMFIDKSFLRNNVNEGFFTAGLLRLSAWTSRSFLATARAISMVLMTVRPCPYMAAQLRLQCP